MSEIKVEFDMNPIDRLKIEIAAIESENAKHIGNYLLEQFSHDEPLLESFQTKKITLQAIMEEIQKCAAKKLNSTNGFISDEQVYGWVLHFVQDGVNEMIAKEATSYIITKEDEEEAKKRAIAKLEEEEIKKLLKQKEILEAKRKEKPKIETISLFDETL